MIRGKQLTSAGQLSAGTTVLITYNGKRKLYKVVEILDAGTDREEVLLDKDNNLYFITSMAIAGVSWARNVEFML